MKSLFRLKEAPGVYAIAIVVTLFGLWAKTDTFKCRQTVADLHIHLAPSLFPDVRQTVFFDGYTDDSRVRFKKMSDANWQSIKQLHPEGVTPQGDLRYPIYVFGSELALLLGYEIEARQSSRFIYARQQICCKTLFER